MLLRVRLRRKLKDVTVNKCLLFILISVTFFNEYLIYTLKAMRWSSIPLGDPKEQMTLLLVSDPQIIGMQDEMNFPIGAVGRWDSDRYLRSTFSRAYRHTNPDVIIFLGDIMDEGSKATNDEFESYVHRFYNIFYETKITKTIVLSGDNDIGGEDGDFRTPFKIHRFEKHFGNLTGLISHKFIDFLKLDIRQNYDDVPEKRRLISSYAPHMKAPVRMIVNHESMMVKFKSAIYPIVQMAQPSLLVSGHWHESLMLKCDTCLSDNDDIYTWPYQLRSLVNLADYIDIDFTNLLALNEVIVPTCSYRMGVPNMAYGVAVVSKSGSVKYTVLWLPCRYTVLLSYAFVLGFIVIIQLIKFVVAPVPENQSFYR